MELYDVKINGLVDPVGYDLHSKIISWKVKDTDSARQENVRIDVAESPEFDSLVYSTEGADLRQSGTPLAFSCRPERRYYYRISVWGDTGDSAVSETHYFETGPAKWSAPWIGCKNEKALKSHPLFRKRFFSERKVRRARCYISAAGLYQAFLNGEKIGKEYLTPFLNDYQTGLQFQTYDITEQITSGSHEIEVLTGNGWYRGKLGYTGKRAVFGDELAITAEIVLQYEDGTEQRILTDGTWTVGPSPVLDSDIYDGEIRDDRVSRDVNAAEPAIEVKIPYPVIERISMPLVEKEQLSVQEVLYTPNGEYVLDFGQNFTGIVEFDTSVLEKGDTVCLEAGEVLQKGCFYHENYRDAKARFVYTSDGTAKLVSPFFTYTGMRYVRVSGWRGIPGKEMFTGIVLYSDLERTGWIHTSNPELNRLYENSVWSQKCNFIDIPLDCPQRNERLGWTGDIQVFAPTACYHMDCRAFLGKFMRDLAADQRRHQGSVANYIPAVDSGRGAAVWGDAATFVPMTLYQQYGDKSILEENYPMMKAWVDSITRRDRERGEQYRFNFGSQFGDWLALDGATDQSFTGETENGFIGSAYYYASAAKVSEAAGILGLKEEQNRYEELARRIKAAFLEDYFTPAGRLAMDTQTGYYTALRFRLFPEGKKAQLLQGLQLRLKKDCYEIRSGFVGATMMCCVLAQNGMPDMAYRFLLNRDYPGWLFEVDHGATTIWERWNSLKEDGSISGTGMNSLNHYAYGSAVEFLYRYAAGIETLKPGFERIRIAPQFSVRLPEVKAVYESAAGRIVSQWSLTRQGDVQIHIELPFQTTGELVLPDGSRTELVPGAFDHLYQPVKKYLYKYDRTVTLRELAADKRARGIMERCVAPAKAIIEGKNREYMAMTFDEMYRTEELAGSLGYVPEELDRAWEQIRKLCWYD